MATKAENEILNKVYLWMTAGLAVTGITSYLMIAIFPSLVLLLLQNFYLLIGIFLLQLAFVWLLSSKLSKGEISPTTGIRMFIIFAILNGIVFTPILLAYTAQSIFHVFFITAGVFGAASFYGYVTKRDLSGLGGILFMGVIGLIISLIVDAFLGGVFSFILSILGVIIFTALASYNTQQIKEFARHKNRESLAVLGALRLYISFINLFIFLLRLFGTRRG